MNEISFYIFIFLTELVVCMPKQTKGELTFSVYSFTYFNIFFFLVLENQDKFHVQVDEDQLFTVLFSDGIMVANSFAGDGAENFIRTNSNQSKFKPFSPVDVDLDGSKNFDEKNKEVIENTNATDKNSYAGSSNVNLKPYKNNFNNEESYVDDTDVMTSSELEEKSKGPVLFNNVLFPILFTDFNTKASTKKIKTFEDSIIRENLRIPIYFFDFMTDYLEDDGKENKKE